MISNNPFITEFVKWAQSQTGRDVIDLGLLISLIIEIVTLIAMWKVFAKAGKPGWAVLVPIYNRIVLLEILGDPWWWLFGLMIPVVRFIVRIFMSLDLASVFGKNGAFGVGLLILEKIFIPILGFGDAGYEAPPAEKG